jgi:diguanylate cyclase
MRAVDMTPQSPIDEPMARRRLDEGRRLAHRLHMPRVVGLVIGAICVGGGLYEAAAAWWAWSLLVFHALSWAHIARELALRARDPYRAEMRNMVLDSAFGGVWIVLMDYNPAPSAILIAMLAMDKAAVGGMRLLIRGLAAQFATIVAVALLLQAPFHLYQSGLVARFSTLPLLFFYPVAVGYTAYRLAGRVKRQNMLLAALSSTDGLTKLPNHTAWLEAVEREYARARRAPLPAAVLMLDLDHFKTINDDHGHPAGDEVLRAVAEVLRGSLRQHDVPGRYGGEEFGVLLPDTSLEAAEAIAERIRSRIAAERFSFSRTLRVTASVGCASLAASDATPSAWIARADRALYRAKKAGRNRTLTDVPQSAAA